LTPGGDGDVAEGSAPFAAGFGALSDIAGIVGGGGRVAGAVDRLRPPAIGIEVLHRAVEVAHCPTAGGAGGQPELLQRAQVPNAEARLPIPALVNLSGDHSNCA